MNGIMDRIQALWSQASAIWIQGGWAMIAIAFIALAMFGVGMHIYLGLRSRETGAVPEATWRGWIDRPQRRTGVLGDLLDFVAGSDSMAETAQRFDQLRARETTPFERDLKVMKVCVSAAPLVGLLGTVTGMLATFGALSSGSGGEKTMSMVAKGISEALITTETGLVIALPGLFFLAQLERKFAGYKAFIAHLETVCTQALYRRQSAVRASAAHRAATQQIARAVVGRIREQATNGSHPQSSRLDGNQPSTGAGPVALASLAMAKADVTGSQYSGVEQRTPDTLS